MLVDPLLNFLSLTLLWAAREISRRDVFEVGILDGKININPQHPTRKLLTSLPNLLAADSFKTRLPMILATLLAILQL